MIDPVTGIHVRVVKGISHLNKSTFDEYEAPATSKHHAPDRNERFIEAVTDQPFSFRIYVSPAFQWGGADGLRIDFIIDGSLKAETYLTKGVVHHGGRTIHGITNVGVYGAKIVFQHAEGRTNCKYVMSFSDVVLGMGHSFSPTLHCFDMLISYSHSTRPPLQ